ncbi:class I SAM-dependent methyltransferase [Chitinophaga qingshengii]|uniref:tRNA (guanine(46)-N(7))-methyltransferase n=1 Tax=Chitinophaga qingshengii TaxID=1569794 RepID=A0ABR7TWN5_9BACT|nr:class I SAM-dependent methyltransferase [Chitinophaga qingshengii]MBC9934895.1 class I SAM-dependent methyltransferase [Chitinophaga qingshengii]
MNKHENDLHLRLLNSLENIQDEYFSLTDEQEKRALLLHACNVIAGEQGDNLRNIIGHYIQADGLDYDQLAGFLLGRINNAVDSLIMERERNDNFDGRFNTVTSLLINQYELPEPVSFERYETAARYNPSPVTSAGIILGKLREYGVQYRDYTFIDIGAGMGRVLLQAADFPFRKIIGVELSPYLHEQANTNISIYHAPGMKCTNLQSVCTNALDFQLPEENMVLYFWHPFDEDLAAAFMQKLEDFLARRKLRIVLIFLEVSYLRVEHSPVFNKIEQFSVPTGAGREDVFLPVNVFSNF